MRRRRSFRSSKKARDLIWITTMVEASVAESTSLDICQLVLSGDWSTGNAGFDRATILGVRGWLGYAMVAGATATEATAAWLAMYVTDGSVPSNSMDPNTATEYSLFDVLWTDGFVLTTTGGSASSVLPRQIEVKARRKITTASEVRLAVTLPTDSGTPRITVAGCLRTLLRLDPPS